MHYCKETFSTNYDFSLRKDIVDDNNDPTLSFVFPYEKKNGDDDGIKSVKKGFTHLNPGPDVHVKRLYKSLYFHADICYL